jgi:hypothetical protein
MIFSQREKTLELMRGNAAAADFLETIVEVLHFWDDLIDRDKVIEDEAIHEAFYKLLIALPRNSFYREHFVVLNTILMNAITNWHVANKFEREGGEYEQRIAYILRSSYVDLVTNAALIVGGPDYGRQVGEEIRRYAHKETYEGYLANLQQETAARAAQKG